jgi:hypothetical protein
LYQASNAEYIRPSLSWVVTQHMLVVIFRRFGTVYRSCQAVKDCLILEDGNNYQHTPRNTAEERTFRGSCHVVGREWRTRIASSYQKLKRDMSSTVQVCCHYLSFSADTRDITDAPLVLPSLSSRAHLTPNRLSLRQLYCGKTVQE